MLLDTSLFEPGITPVDLFEPPLRAVGSLGMVCSPEAVRRWLKTARFGDAIIYWQGGSLPHGAGRAEAPALLLLDESRAAHMITYLAKLITVPTSRGPERIMQRRAIRVDASAQTPAPPAFSHRVSKTRSRA